MGCAAHSRQGITPEAQAAFRTESVRVLENAAFSDEPSDRMDAIEAFKEVAPAEGLSVQAIPLNIENAYPGASFAALMAAGEIGADYLKEIVRTRAENSDPNVRMAAIFALHKFGDASRTSELADLLLHHSDPKVRANAALVLGRLGGGPSQIRLLKTALRHEKKDLPKLQILEALATLGDKYATERLLLDAYSAVPQQAAVALMMLANAKSDQAEDVFWYALQSKWPEVQLQAARGLARLGHPQGLQVALRNLNFDSAKPGNPVDPPAQQIKRVRGLAALALEAIADPAALDALKRAMNAKDQSSYVRIAVARAAIRTINGCRPDLVEAVGSSKPAPARRLAGDSRQEPQ